MLRGMFNVKDGGLGMFDMSIKALYIFRFVTEIRFIARIFQQGVSNVASFKQSCTSSYGIVQACDQSTPSP